MLIMGMPGNHASQHDILADTQICRSIRDKAQPTLKQAHPSLLAILVVYHRREQAGPQGQTHGGHLYRDRAWQDQGLFTWVQQRLHFRVNKTVSNCFLIAMIDQHGLHALQGQIGLTVFCHHQIGAHWHIRDVVVAIDTGHFFYQILFDFHIETPAWRHRQPVVALFGNLATQATQNIAHLLAWHYVANQTVQLFTTQCNGGTLR
ncbi:hypothetical protein D3C79_741860 [compost metagenome]